MTFRSCLFAASCCLATPAMAYQAGDILVRGGIAHVSPDSSMEPVSSPVGALNGLDDIVTVDSGNGVTATATYMFHKNFGIELVGALPFRHSLQGDGALASVGKIGETKHLPPTVLLQFYPLDSHETVMPYIGIGYNYTFFFGNDTNAAFAGAVGDVIGADVTNTTLDLSDSHGIAAEVGADWPVTGNLSLNTSVWYLDISSRAHVDATLSSGAEVKDAATFDVEIDPFVFAFGAAWTF
jgi:outer membrane protein